MSVRSTLYPKQAPKEERGIPVKEIPGDWTEERKHCWQISYLTLSVKQEKQQFTRKIPRVIVTVIFSITEPLCFQVLVNFRNKLFQNQAFIAGWYFSFPFGLFFFLHLWKKNEHIFTQFVSQLLVICLVLVPV